MPKTYGSMTISDISDGVGIAKTVPYYLASENSSGVTVNDPGWSRVVPELTSEKKYLWIYYVNVNGVGDTEPELINASGDIVTFENKSDDAPLNEVKAYIEPVQDFNGYDHPWPAGCGKNILPPFEKGVSISSTTGAILTDRPACATTGKILVNFTQNPSYYISGLLDTLRVFIAAYNVNDEFLGRSAGANATTRSVRADTFSFGTPSGTGDVAYVRVTIYEYETNTGVIDDIDNMTAQMEAGDSASSYEPYSNVCPISGFTGMNITRTGKNLIPLSKQAVTSRGIQFTPNEDGSVTINGTNDGTGNSFSGSIGHVRLKPGRYKKTPLQNDCYVYVQYKINSTTWTSVPGGGSSSTEFTIEEGMDYDLAIRISVRSGATVDNFTYYPYIYPVNETDFTFESPNREVINVDFPSEAGTVYSGYVDVTTGELIVTHWMFSENTSTMNNNESCPGWKNTGVAGVLGYGHNRFYNVTGNIGTIVGVNTNGATSDTQGTIWFPMGTYGYNQTQFKELAIDVQLLFELATPIVYHITPQQIVALQGVNHIWSSAGSTEISYYENQRVGDPYVVGVYGDNGDEGVGIASIASHFQISSSPSTAPTTWSDTMVATTPQSPYLWSYETITYTDGTTSDSTKRVIGTHGEDGKMLYGTCDTAAGTPGKVVVCDEVTSLYNGLTIAVKFTNANTSGGNITLNVNGTGAKNINFGSTTSSTNQFLWGARATIQFMYTGAWTPINCINSYTGLCQTVSSNAQKTGEIAGDVIVCRGTTVNLTMSYPNSTVNTTLNVDSTGPKQIRANKGPLLANSIYNWEAGSNTTFTFDGQYWQLMGGTSSYNKIASAVDMISDLQAQVDGKIQTWTQSTDPSTTWTTSLLQQAHDGDLWYYTGDTDLSLTGITIHNNSTYKYDAANTTWTEHSINTDLFDKIDGKMAVFYGSPSGTYLNVEAGDLLVDTNGTTYKWVIPQSGDPYWEVASSVEVGGRNLFRKSATFTTDDWLRVRSSVTSEGIITLTPTTSAAYAKPKINYLTYGELKNNPITISCDVRDIETGEYSGTTGYVRLYIGIQKADRINVTLQSSYDRYTYKNCITEGTTNWQRISFTIDSFDVDHLEIGKEDYVVDDSDIVSFEPYRQASTQPVECRNFMFEKGNHASDWSPAPEDTQSAINAVSERASEYILGTQTAATRFWTGNSSVLKDINDLKDGTQITYWLPYAYKSETAQSKGITAEELTPTEDITKASSNDWLNLTLANGQQTGWVPCYYSNTSRLTSHYAANNAIRLTYRANFSSSIPRGWWADANYEGSNYYDRTAYKASLTSDSTVNGGAIAAGRIAVMNSSGKLEILSTRPFDVTCPILYVGTAYTASALTQTNNYTMWGTAFSLKNTVSSLPTLTAGKPVYIKGTLSGKIFTPDAGVFTTTEPISEDGKFYLLFGTMSTAVNAVMNAEHPIYQFSKGSFKTAGQIASDAQEDVDAVKSYAESLETQIDGKAETWYQSTDPSTNWTAAEKTAHIGDLWYNTTSTVQKYYRYDGTNWQEITSNPPTAVFDRIDGKARVFIAQPEPPYAVGDLWFDSATSDIMTCVAVSDPDSYTASDWVKRNKYTDDTTAMSAQDIANVAQDTANEAHSVAAEADVNANNALTQLSTMSGYANTISDYELLKALYLDFSSDPSQGLTIGGKTADGSESIFNTNITNTQMSFNQNGETIAYINGLKYHIRRGEIEQSLTVGSFEWRVEDIAMTGDTFDLVLL